MGATVSVITVDNDDEITEEEIAVIAQFYKVPREFRLLGENGWTEADFDYDPELGKAAQTNTRGLPVGEG